MLPDRVSNPGPLTHESGALPIMLRGPAMSRKLYLRMFFKTLFWFGDSNYIRRYHTVC